MGPPARAVGVIGPGRAGTGLALALAGAGYAVLLHGRRPQRVPKPLSLTVGPADAPPAWIAQAGVVVLAVPDDAIRPVAELLARAAAVSASQVVLHLSGVQGQEALGPLVSSGAALGSLHPLQTITDPERAPDELRGAWAALEGMPAAIVAAEALARGVGMRPFRVTSAAKAVYHAGAVFSRPTTSWWSRRSPSGSCGTPASPTPMRGPRCSHWCAERSSICWSAGPGPR